MQCNRVQELSLYESRVMMIVRIGHFAREEIGQGSISISTKSHARRELVKALKIKKQGANSLSSC